MRILILYGTETGNAQDYAEMTAKKCQRLRFTPAVRSIDECTVADLAVETYLIVICSTTGQGELPRNALKLWKQLLRRKLPLDTFKGVNFTTFGLGDSSYPRYNWAIRKIHKRLVQLGAHEFSARGEGDDQHSEGAEPHFDSWLNVTAEKLSELAGVADVVPDTELLAPRFTLTIDKTAVKRGEAVVNAPEVNCTRSDATIGVVKSNDRITADDHFQDVRHLVFECDESVSYAPGDTVAIYPRNEAAEVELLIKHQDWDGIADLPVTVNDEFEMCVPGGLVKPLTLRSLLIYHLDINSIPRRSFFATAWHFASDEREQERLQEFSTLDGLEDLFNYANRPRRSILEAIIEFDTLKIPISHILDVIPILRPRLFSIASSCAKTGASHFELAIAVVKYKTVLKRIRRGVCTRYISSLTEGCSIPFTHHKSPFPATEDQPLIMIAPGTGVAPMRSLIYDRLEGQSKEMMLFFGCRYKQKDFIFSKEWEQLSAARGGDDAKLNALQVVCAFSREGGGYVQNKLFEHKAQVADWIVNKNAMVALCGSSGAMPRQVRITLIDVVKHLVDNAEEYVAKMELQGRYLQETWG